MEKGEEKGGKEKSGSVLLKSLFCGGMAGMASKSFVAPLDRVKILLQTQNSAYKNKGVVSALGLVLRREGLVGLYRGNGVQMLRVFPYGAIQFGTFEILKRFLIQNPRNPPGSEKSANLIRQIDKDRASVFLAGSVGGVCGVTATFPLDTIRARLAYHTKSEVGYSGMRDTFTTILKQDGVKGFYRGLIPTVIAICPQSGFSFFFFDVVKTGLIERFPLLRVRTGTDRYDLSIPGKLLAGGSSGAMAQTLTYPLDVTRRKMQLGQGTGVWQVLIHTYTTDGVVKGLYRGMSVNYLRGVPLSAISFCTYECLKQLLGISASVKL